MDGWIDCDLYQQTFIFLVFILPQSVGFKDVFMVLSLKQPFFRRFLFSPQLLDDNSSHTWLVLVIRAIARRFQSHQ